MQVRPKVITFLAILLDKLSYIARNLFPWEIDLAKDVPLSGKYCISN